MANILINTSSFNNELFEAVRKKGFNVYQNTLGQKLSEQQVQDLINKYQPVGIIAGLEPLTANVLAAAENLKVISRCGVGVDNVDLEAAKARGIEVINTPNAPVQAVTELTIALILAGLRRIIEADTSVRNGSWNRPMGKLLGEQILGIVGCGKVGSAVAEIVSSFGTEVIGYDPLCKDHPLIDLVSMEKLLAVSDIVTLHLPYDKENYHMFNEEMIKKMKSGALLVNTARGELVDERALYNTLKAGHLSGACLDVFEAEPYTGPLRKLPQVVLTPHVGSYAKEARMKMEKEAVDNLSVALKCYEE